MKNGLLIYKSYENQFNIGDYIQSLAARQFLKQPILFINREELDEYKGEKVNMIMNGWFMHEPKHWPPSKKVNPLFVSFHLNTDAYELLDNTEAIDYFKKHEPIGCRDKKTAELLSNKGVIAYYSGCLTLTLGNTYKTTNTNDEIYFVDPLYYSDKNISTILRNLKTYFSNKRTINIIAKKMFLSSNIKKIFLAVSFFNTYRKAFSKQELINANYINHIVKSSEFEDENAKFSYAESLLDKYSKAKLIVTSRIHCVLPALSLGTPVVYTDALIHKDTSSCRLDGLKDLFNTLVVSKDGIDEKLSSINFNQLKNLKNKSDYISIKQNLENIIQKDENYHH